MERKTFRAARAAAVALSLALGLAGTARADVYLSLGDSVAFGIEDSMSVASYGTGQGYAKDYAGYLAQKNGGATTLLNLAVPGETSTSFTTGSGRIGPDNLPPSAPEDALLVALNKNYTDYASQNNTAPPTQQFLLDQALASYKTSITDVTIRLGADDLFATALSPGFFAKTPAEQSAAIGQTLSVFAANEAAILMDLKANLPDANIILVGSYNPFPAGFPGPLTDLAGPAILGLNDVIQGLADTFHVAFANPYAAFVGNELAYTYVADNGNVHPNDLGYSVIAGVIEAVPEPSTFALTALGLAALIVAGRGHRRAGLLDRA